MISLDVLNKSLSSVKMALNKYEEITNRLLGFDGLSFFEQYDNKGYFAKAITDVDFYDSNIGKMHIVAFKPEDGTGDESTFRVTDILTPERLDYNENPFKIIPRSKYGVLYELFFPLLCLDQYGEDRFAVCLEELTVIDNKIVSLGNIGISQSEFRQAINSGLEIMPHIGMTTASVRPYEFGDPHAIHYDPRVLNVDKEYVQIAGFLSFTEPYMNLDKFVEEYCTVYPLIISEE